MVIRAHDKRARGGGRHLHACLPAWRPARIGWLEKAGQVRWIGGVRSSKSSRYMCDVQQGRCNFVDFRVYNARTEKIAVYDGALSGCPYFRPERRPRGGLAQRCGSASSARAITPRKHVLTRCSAGNSNKPCGPPVPLSSIPSKNKLKQHNRL